MVISKSLIILVVFLEFLDTKILGWDVSLVTVKRLNFSLSASRLIYRSDAYYSQVHIGPNTMVCAKCCDCEGCFVESMDSAY